MSALATFEAFVDLDGGEWIKITSGEFAGAVWRPAQLNVTEEGAVDYVVEFLMKGEVAAGFDEVSNSIMQEILMQYLVANENG